MLDRVLIDALERLTPPEQKAVLAVAEYLQQRRASGETGTGDVLLAELSEPHFSSPDEGLSPARQAARKFMRENSVLMHLLAQ